MWLALLLSIPALAANEKLSAVTACVQSYSAIQRSLDLCMGGTKSDTCPKSLPAGEMIWRLYPRGADRTLHLARLHGDQITVHSGAYKGAYFEKAHPFRIGSACYQVQPRAWNVDRIVTAEPGLCPAKAGPIVSISEDDLLADLIARCSNDLRGLTNQYGKAVPTSQDTSGLSAYQEYLKFREDDCRNAIRSVSTKPGSALASAMAGLERQLDRHKEIVAGETASADPAPLGAPKKGKN